jgi:hypothetical protein
MWCTEAAISEITQALLSAVAGVRVGQRYRSDALFVRKT